MIDITPSKTTLSMSKSQTNLIGQDKEEHGIGAPRHRLGPKPPVFPMERLWSAGTAQKRLQKSTTSAIEGDISVGPRKGKKKNAIAMRRRKIEGQSQQRGGSTRRRERREQGPLIRADLVTGNIRRLGMMQKWRSIVRFSSMVRSSRRSER